MGVYEWSGTQEGRGWFITLGMSEFKKKNKVTNGIGKEGFNPEDKHLFNRRWSDIWDLPGKDEKLWLREVAAARKCGNRIRDIEIIWGGAR